MCLCATLSQSHLSWKLIQYSLIHQLFYICRSLIPVKNSHFRHIEHGAPALGFWDIFMVVWVWNIHRFYSSLWIFLHRNIFHRVNKKPNFYNVMLVCLFPLNLVFRCCTYSSLTTRIMHSCYCYKFLFKTDLFWILRRFYKHATRRHDKGCQWFE